MNQYTTYMDETVDIGEYNQYECIKDYCYDIKILYPHTEHRPT